MTERSRFWDGTSLGDATDAPYSAQEFSQVMLGMLGQGNTSPWQRSFVSFGQGYGVGSLLVTGTSSPVNIASGAACVAGLWYYLDAPTTIAVPTPAANPRRDRIVLRVDWASQTVRLARLAGSEAATPTAPALTQVLGTTWEVSLATAYITTGGVITVTDERVGNIGLGNSVLFRDIAQREYEEFFDNFSTLATSSGWVFTGTGSISLAAGVPSANTLSSGATNGGIGQLFRGTVSGSYYTELNQAPILFEARMTPANAAIDAAAIISMKLQDSAATTYIEFGAIGSISTTNLSLRCANGGAATNFATGTAIDASGAHHTLGILVPASGGPAIALYDDVVIGQVASGVPAATTDMRAIFYTGNGATSAVRATNIDWARLVRGTA